LTYLDLVAPTLEEDIRNPSALRQAKEALARAPVERNTLKEILESDLADLRMEIAGTDLKSFRDKLKEKEAIIIRLIERLSSD
jgi:hypothetical protein